MGVVRVLLMLLLTTPAVAEMESISGKMSGTHHDKAGNYPGYDIIRQMDCIDESTNTFQCLLALEAQTRFSGYLQP